MHSPKRAKLMEDGYESEDLPQTSSTLAQRHQQNPMINPVVLSNLFSLCGPKDLANMRLVCRLWHDLSLTFWRESTPLLFGTHGIITWNDSDTQEVGQVYNAFNDCKIVGREKHHHQEGTKRDAGYAEFSTFVNTDVCNPWFRFQDKPFRQFDIEGWYLTVEDVHMTKLWTSCGAWITSLKLVNCTFYDIEAFKIILCSGTPHLKSLKLECNEYWVNDIKEDNAISNLEISTGLGLKTLKIVCESDNMYWSQMLTHIPGIEHLKLKRSYGDGFRYAEKGLKAAKERNGNQLSLKTFNILHLSCVCEERITNARLQTFKDLELPLESLALDLGKNTKEEVIYELLRLHNDSLRVLKVTRCFLRKPYAGFPFGLSFPSLQELHMYGSISEDMSFLLSTPNLKTLAIRRDPKCTWVGTASDFRLLLAFNTKLNSLPNFVLNSLKNLTIEFECSAHDIDKLTTWMPNVKMLKTILTKAGLRLVCERWTSLTELNIRSKKISREVTKSLNKNDTGENSISSSLDSPIIADVANLVELRQFYMSCGSWPCPLMDSSTFANFRKLKYLHMLEIFIFKTEATRVRQELQALVPMTKVVAIP